MDMKFAADQFADQAQRFSALTGLTRPNPRDRFFLVMGMTGSGKSTFISRSFPKRTRPFLTSQNLNVFPYLGTESIDVFDFVFNGRRVYLVDTPGFNDTNRSDIETLGTLATYLGASYANGVRIHGIIMLHPISDNRMSGSSLRNIEMMKAMCGFTGYENLAIATSMWPATSDYTEKAIAENRETELLDNDQFFGALVTQGASVFRHNEQGRRDPDEEMASAQSIVEHLIQQSDMDTPEVLQLQREIIDQKKTLGETAAGIAIAGDLYKARKAHEDQLRKIEAAMQGELAKVDATHAAELEDLKAEVEQKLKTAGEEKRALKKSIETMRKEEEKIWKEKIDALDRQFQEELKAKEQELLDMEDSLEEIRRDMMQRSKTPRQRAQVAVETAKHEQIVSSARQEVSEARDAYQKFNGKRSEIFKGSLNGIASGVASGVVAAGKLPLNALFKWNMLTKTTL
ncbi:uncharacterized protein N7459_002343 [Penicillium hispanicum]|uniref:uncharacterized protein n=1 Tax=Penicillium hispanicum TaxID=1080232 RepID=UPI0025404AA4|nr:uncharacterized protein N7459_002343 [Penicillium hispanicum]KAJ5591974.1 hypothetical protein N7459_002343 [Penicillium hispanicum]